MPEQNQNQNPDSGRHRVDGDYEYYESIQEPTAAASAGGAAGAGGAVPLRGLAMVLIFIAILLVGWVLYSMFTGDSEDTATGDTEVVVEEPSPEQPPSPAPDDAEGNTGEEQLPDGDADRDEPAPPPAEPATADRGTMRVVVLNNSTFPGWAEETGGMLRDQQGWAHVDGGNLSRDNTGIIEPTVFFDPANEGQRIAAEEIANENGWVAHPRTDVLDDQPTDSVVVVVAGDR